MVILPSRLERLFGGQAIWPNMLQMKERQKNKGAMVLRILSLLMIFTLAFTASIQNADAAKKKSAPKENTKYASIVMDADTGVILSQRYADRVLHPASLTKIMTLLLAFEAIDRGDVRLKDRIRISKHAASMVPSKLDLPVGSTIRMEDAIYILVTKSANDVAVAVAEHLGGTESRFAAMMTSRAHSIGMNNTRFRNASGLHSPSQITTARDMAKLARYVLQRYPHHYRYFSTTNFSYKGKSYRNHNRLMSSYQGMDGFKTGYIGASGFNLVASAHRDGRRLIGVVFGGRTAVSRNTHMAEILDSGFKKVQKIRVASVKTPPLPPEKPVYDLADSQQQTPQDMTSYTSLSSLGQRSTQIKVAPQNQNNEEFTPNYTALTEALQEGTFGEMIGEGDIDPSASKRLETGLIAVSVHKGTYNPSAEPATAMEQSLRDAGHAMIDKIGSQPKEVTSTNVNSVASLPHPKDVVGKWSIQIGAFNSRIATEEALRDAKNKLPKKFVGVTPMAVPLRTSDGLIFRARLGGMSQEEAQNACQYFKDCMPIAPIATIADIAQ